MPRMNRVAIPLPGGKTYAPSYDDVRSTATMSFLEHAEPGNLIDVAQPHTGKPRTDQSHGPVAYLLQLAAPRNASVAIPMATPARRRSSKLPRAPHRARTD